MKALKFVVAACTVGLIVGVGFVALSPYESTPARAEALPPPGTPVPNLVGESLDAAEAALEQRGVPHDVIGDDGFVGIVFPETLSVCDMNPYGPATVPDGRSVTLYVDSYCS